MNERDQFTQELAELKGFIADLKTDRTAQKEKERREAWTKYTAISLVFIAVLTAIATQWAGKYSSRVLTNLNDSTFYQAEASDQWSYYQSKSIKQNLYEAVRDLRSAGVTNGEAFEARIAKYKADEEQIMADAKKLEQQRNEARTQATRASQHGSAMGNSIAIFQIAIALGSICLVTKKKSLWYLSLLLAALATIKMVQVWLV